jgi:hypothetical protein
LVGGDNGETALQGGGGQDGIDIEGKIWELREESGTNIYRILYFFASGRRIVLLHGFAKSLFVKSGQVGCKRRSMRWIIAT